MGKLKSQKLLHNIDKLGLGIKCSYFFSNSNVTEISAFCTSAQHPGGHCFFNFYVLSALVADTVILIMIVP